MANLNPPTNGTANPNSPVDLTTIPISPADGTNGGDSKMVDGNTSLNGGGVKREYKGDEQITVFHDPDNFNVKHPLMNHWTLWFTKPPSGKVGHPASE